MPVRTYDTLAIWSNLPKSSLSM